MVFSTNGSNAICGVTGYSQQLVNLNTYADGNAHLIEFSYTTFSQNSGSTNFFIDDVSLIAVTSGGCPNIVLDGGLESGGGAAWSQTSTNFGTPVCNLSNCGTGGGTGPRTGNYWARFGGFAGGVEQSSLSQIINFQSGNNITLKFYLEQKKCDGPQDFLEVRVDNQIVFYKIGRAHV